MTDDELSNGKLGVVGVENGMVKLLFASESFALDIFLPPAQAKGLTGDLIMAISEIEGGPPEITILPDDDDDKGSSDKIDM